MDIFKIYDNIVSIMKEYKNYLIGAGSVVLVLAVIFGFRILGHKNGEVAVVETPVVNESIANPVVTPKKVTHTKKPVATPKMSYADALKAYSGGYRIQFDSKCQAFPRSSVYSNGTTIMLDNRTDKEQDIKIGGSTYKVAAYDYEIAKLTTTKSPTEYLVDCGSQQNPATIIVE